MGNNTAKISRFTVLDALARIRFTCSLLMQEVIKQLYHWVSMHDCMCPGGLTWKKHWSGAPAVLMQVLFPIEAILQRVPLGFNLDKAPSGHVNSFDIWYNTWYINVPNSHFLQRAALCKGQVSSRCRDIHSIAWQHVEFIYCDTDGKWLYGPWRPSTMLRVHNGT